MSGDLIHIDRNLSADKPLHLMVDVAGSVRGTLSFLSEWTPGDKDFVIARPRSVDFIQIVYNRTEHIATCIRLTLEQVALWRDYLRTASADDEGVILETQRAMYVDGMPLQPSKMLFYKHEWGVTLLDDMDTWSETRIRIKLADEPKLLAFLNGSLR